MTENRLFDWKSCCFICGQKCHKNKRLEWSRVEGSINEQSMLYKQVVEAAKIRNDQEVLKRLLSIDGDFVAAEAR